MPELQLTGKELHNLLYTIEQTMEHAPTRTAYKVQGGTLWLTYEPNRDELCSRCNTETTRR